MNSDILTKKQTKPSDQKAAKQNELKQAHSFYSIKHKSGIFQGITIKKAKIVDKLKEYNFFRFDIDEDTCRFVYIEDNKVREVNKEKITDKFVKFIESLEPYTHNVSYTYGKEQKTQTVGIEIKPNLIRETLFEKLSEYFSKALLYRLTPNKPIRIKKDTLMEKFFYYNNGFVKVTRKGFKFLDYKELDLNIWENQKLNRDFKEDKTKGDFEQFIECVCTVRSQDDRTKYVFDKKRFEALKTIIGYNLHGYFNSKLRATILTDSRLSDDDEPNGRTGKTLLAKAMGEMLNYKDEERKNTSRVYCEINGKDFNPRDKHRYSDASIETQLININDLARNTTIETFFNDITEGITVDKKNEKPFGITAKIIISTNKTIRIDGDSAADRVLQFEFSDYFNKDRSPVSEFGGKWMFSKDYWKPKDYNQFDTFMISCVVDYLNKGIIEAPSISLHRRTLIDHTNHEFVDFIDDFINGQPIEYKGQNNDLFDDNIIKFEYGKKINKKLLCMAFIEQYPNDHHKLSQVKFTKWLRAYAKHTDTLQDISKTNETEGRSNGLDWVMFNQINMQENE